MFPPGETKYERGTSVYSASVYPAPGSLIVVPNAIVTLPIAPFPVPPSNRTSLVTPVS